MIDIQSLKDAATRVGDLKAEMVFMVKVQPRVLRVGDILFKITRHETHELHITAVHAELPFPVVEMDMFTASDQVHLKFIQADESNKIVMKMSDSIVLKMLEYWAGMAAHYMWACSFWAPNDVAGNAMRKTMQDLQKHAGQIAAAPEVVPLVPPCIVERRDALKYAMTLAGLKPGDPNCFVEFHDLRELARYVIKGGCEGRRINIIKDSNKKIHLHRCGVNGLNFCSKALQEAFKDGLKDVRDQEPNMSLIEVLL